MSDYISRQAAITLLSNVPQVDDLTITLTEKEREKYAEKFLSVIPAADVVEVGKPYFYEQGYIFKDFNNGGEHRYFVIERADK